MSHIPKILDAFARLLTYPDQHTPQAAELLYIVLAGELDEAARAIAKFGGFLEQHEQWEVEEAFTGTFDVNPTCALEVGWHLFGEEYARGLFLVRMREEMRRYQLSESVELPDHISHVLAIVSSMPEEKAAKFVTACVQPAIEKMNQALSEKETPYRDVVAALARVVEQKWGECRTVDQHSVLASRSDVDPLHAFPVADVGCGTGCGSGCGGSHGEPDVVALSDFSGKAPMGGSAPE